MTAITFAKKLMTVRPSRAAIVPYCIVNGTVYFVFGIDSKYGDITDLGGGVRKYESAVTGAMREFTEESHNVFSRDISVNSLVKNLAISDKKMAVIFMHIPISTIRESIGSFHNTDMGGCTEVRDLIVVTDDDLVRLSRGMRCKGRVMWSRVRRFYNASNITQIISILKALN